MTIYDILTVLQQIKADIQVCVYSENPGFDCDVIIDNIYIRYNEAETVRPTAEEILNIINKS